LEYARRSYRSNFLSLPQMTLSNLAAVRRTLEGAGIKFIFEEDGALGVCL
jgi:hypothetical protein